MLTCANYSKVGKIDPDIRIVLIGISVLSFMVLFTGCSYRKNDMQTFDDIGATVRHLKSASPTSEIDIPHDIRFLLFQLKHHIRDAMISIVNDTECPKQCSSDHILKIFIEKLKTAGVVIDSCEGAPQNNIFGGYPPTGRCEYGLINEITFKYLDDNLLAMTTKLGIPCGNDSILYIMQKHSDGWKLIFAFESNDYTEISGAYGSFGYGVSPRDENGNFFIVTAHINPWCSSNWQGLYFNVFRPSPDPYKPKLLMKEETSIFLGRGEPFYNLAVDKNSFAFSFLAEQGLEGGYIRGYILKYQVNRDMLVRTTPIADEPEGFLDEWIKNDWKEASQWIRPSDTDFEHWHSIVRKAMNSNTLYHGFSICNPDSEEIWQILLYFEAMEDAVFPIEFPEKLFFTIINEQGVYYMKNISTERPPECHE